MRGRQASQPLKTKTQSLARIYPQANIPGVLRSPREGIRSSRDFLWATRFMRGRRLILCRSSCGAKCSHFRFILHNPFRNLFLRQVSHQQSRSEEYSALAFLNDDKAVGAVQTQLAAHSGGHSERAASAHS